MKPYATYYPQDPEGGTAMVEFVIVFPMWVLMTLGIMQLSLMHAASNITQTAAFVSARAATVKDDSDLKDVDHERPAKFICTPITGNSQPLGIAMPTLSKPSGMNSTIDYLLALVTREITGSLFPKTKVTLFETLDGDSKPTEKQYADLKKIVCVQCQHKFELVMPVVNSCFVSFISLKSGIVMQGIGGIKNGALQRDFSLAEFDKLFNDSGMASLIFNTPHAVIHENAMIFRPWAEDDKFKDKGQNSNSGS